MKTLFEICSPRPDILKGDIRESDFAADLAQVINGTAPLEYALPNKFFANTHPTQGLKALLKIVCQRLQGLGGSAVLRLDTQYGGGKTHSLIALTHAAQGMKGVENILEFIDPELVPTIAVRLAAFDGENADPLNGRPLGDGLRAYTPWGELAYGLAGVAGYEKVRQSDLERVAPGAATIQELFGDRPVLILLDELSIYLRKIKGRKEQDQLTPFLTALFKAVSSSAKACVVFTLAVGKEGKATDAYSQENEFIAEKLDEATKVAGRVATLLNPTTEQETVQVLRRRLFAYIDNNAAEEVIRNYEQLWISHRSDLPTERVNADRVADFRNGFPFHPALMDLFTDKLSTLSTFQRVRGMLRLLTRTIAHLWQEKPANTSAIHLHHVNPGYIPIRDEITTRLELGRFDPVIENDVAATQGGTSLAQQLDAKWYAGLAHYASFVARNILWHTFAFNDNLQGVDEVNLRYAILAPGLDVGFINDARQKFIAESAYLDDRPVAPLRFLTEVNLGVLIRRQTKQVDTNEARSLLQDRIRTIFDGKTLNLILFAGGAYDVADDVGDGKPNLVLISYDAETVRNEAVTVPQLVENIYRTQGSQGKFRQLQNNLVFLVADDASRDEMKNKMLYRLALEAMRSPDRLAQLPEHQQEKVNELYKKSEQELAIIIQQCYRHLFYPSRNRLDGSSVDLAHTAFDLPSASQRPGHGQQEIIQALIDNQKLLPPNSEPPAPNYVRDQTPLKKGQISTAELRAEFRKDPRFPIMLGNDPFIKMVRLGIEQGIYVYQSGDLLLGQGDPYAEIKIDEQSIVFTATYAKERGIWPRRPVTPASENGNSAEGSISTESSSGGGISYGNTSTGTPSSMEGTRGYVTVPPTTPGNSSTPSPVRSNIFKAEAPLREALTKIWEDARSAQIKKINLLSLRVFDSSDGFKLLGVINTVIGADKQIKLSAEYETTNSSSFSIEFTGQVSDAQPIKDFLQPQLRAASETHVEITFTLTYASGLDLNSDEPEKMTEKLARFATGAAYVEAYAEAR
ncbi:ATP-binding protein [Chroococcidiopsidales cyanobacterium LEGE 13417]|nr:ATP-binding protein [Chroococcidiopsidales cyanobacterium LEGE 13417]